MQYLDYSYFGEESALHLMARAADFLTYLGKECEKSDWNNDNIAVVTHGGVIQAMLSYILKKDMNSKVLPISNCSVTVLRYYKGLWTVRLVNYTGSLLDFASSAHTVAENPAEKLKADLY